MTFYALPTEAEVGGRAYEVRSDYRAILDAIGVLSDPDYPEEERTLLVLQIVYPDFDSMPYHDYQEALEWAFWFIGGGSEPMQRKQPKLMDWKQDFPLIVAPVNRVIGCEVRALEYMHWWTFLSAYYEIGDCLFAQVVSIRKKKAKGKKLDKSDDAFYRENIDIIDIKTPVTEAEGMLMNEWTRAV